MIVAVTPVSSNSRCWESPARLSAGSQLLCHSFIELNISGCKVVGLSQEDHLIRPAMMMRAQDLVQGNFRFTWRGRAVSDDMLDPVGVSASFEAAHAASNEPRR